MKGVEYLGNFFQKNVVINYMKLPFLVFAGRSNAGKSSLINTLTNSKKIAKTSNKPGKTQAINFFLVEKKYIFSDLPGYGFAKVSIDTRDKWLVQLNAFLGYISDSKNLLVLVIDCRREPDERDKVMKEAAEYYGIETVVALTKMDKLSNNKVASSVAKISKFLNLEKENICPVSSLTKKGINALWSRVKNRFIS